jgi:hypothetical protein
MWDEGLDSVSKTEVEVTETPEDNFQKRMFFSARTGDLPLQILSPQCIFDYFLPTTWSQLIKLVGLYKFASDGETEHCMERGYGILEECKAGDCADQCGAGLVMSQSVLQVLALSVSRALSRSSNFGCGGQFSLDQSAIFIFAACSSAVQHTIHAVWPTCAQLILAPIKMVIAEHQHLLRYNISPFDHLFIPKSLKIDKNCAFALVIVYELIMIYKPSCWTLQFFQAIACNCHVFQVQEFTYRGDETKYDEATLFSLVHTVKEALSTGGITASWCFKLVAK